MFKRKQQDVTDGSKHWYQDKYQHVLAQRNIMALIALVALFTAAVSVFAVMRLAPLKSVDPYLIQIEEKTGVTQFIKPLSREAYTANDAVDKYFTAQYIRLREGYNYNILSYNYNVVKLLSSANVWLPFWRTQNPKLEGSNAMRLGQYGRREIKIRSMVYLKNPTQPGQKTVASTEKTLQANVTITESTPNAMPAEKRYIITITFDYGDRDLNTDDQLLNPLGYYVTNYQVEQEN